MDTVGGGYPSRLYFYTLRLPGASYKYDWIVKMDTVGGILPSSGNKMNCELMLTYDTPALRQLGSRNLTGPNIRFLPSIVAEKNATKNEHICSMCIKINKVGKQEVGIWWVQKRFPRYGVPIWSLWPNIRFLPSIVAEKNVTKNVHICSMCIKTNQVGKQEVGIWRVQKRYPQYGIPIWHLWPNIRFLPSTVTEKNATKNILEGRTEVKPYTPSPFGERGYKN